jgi:hypothetical protein
LHVPEYPDVMFEMGFDPETPAGRFNPRPAVAISTGEYGEGDDALAEEVVRGSVGDWLLEDEPSLGRAEARSGSAGRGAEGWTAVVQWLGEAIANNVVDIAVGYALAKTLGRLRRRKDEREAEGQHLGIEVSRGAAAVLAAASVAEEFGERGPLEVEAVEEPSSIAGHEITELSYVGLEPWIVLLRNTKAEVRYVTVVLPDGAIGGNLRVPFLPFEAMFLRPSRFQDQPRRRSPRRRRRFRR